MRKILDIFEKFLADDAEERISYRIASLYDQILTKACDGTRWTKFSEQLSQLDEALGKSVKKRPDRAEFESELTDI